MKLIHHITILLMLGVLGCRPGEASPVTLTDTVSDQAPQGQLAYIGGDGNVYVTTAAQTETIAVTNDATTFYEGPGLSYQRLAWSPDGRLAYASVLRRGDMAQSRLYVAHRPGQPAQLVGQSNDHFVIYMYWSPTTCPERPDCRHLAYLIEEEVDIALRLVAIAGDTVENRALGYGWPFYFSWAADGNAILWHTGYRNPNARLVLYNLEQNTVDTLSQQPGNFIAPAWSPQRKQWLGVIVNDEQGYIQRFDQEETPLTIADAAEGDSVFAWSPNGQQIAYAIRRYATDPFYGPVYLYDAKTNQSTRLTDAGLRILAFFWSPDGNKLAYLTRQVLPETEWVQWRVYNLATGRDRGFSAFQPTLQMRFIMASFNQYAQSHRFWSPDGRYLVYGNRNDAAGTEQVWLIDTLSEENNSIYVDDGTMGFWSWN